MNRAVILAGGSGSRAGGEIPKQFVLVEEKPIIAYTIEVFNNHPLIDDIIVVSKEEYVNSVIVIKTKYNFHKVSKVVAGGKERFESSIAAINSCENGDDNDILLFHDCARPLVSDKIITDCLDAMKHHDAVTVAIPATDTLYFSEDLRHINMIPSRKNFLNAQTPQCFRLKTIKTAYSLAKKDPEFLPSDDCSIIKRYIPTCDIFIVEGDCRNFKITYKQDIELFKLLLN